MAERRMFSNNIINSANFLRMPSTSRLLYYDLGMAADDDGVVEAYVVMKKTGATEDDLNVLITKGFIIVLDAENLIVFIRQWKENNKLRADRKKNSIYKELLLQIVPDVQLLEPTQRADLKQKNVKQKNIENEVDSQWTSSGQHSVGKCSVVECSIDNTLQYKTIDYYNYLIGKSDFSVFSTQTQQEQMIKVLKELDLYVNETIDSVITEEKRTDFQLQYWAIKEILFSNSKVYFKYLTRELFLDKYLRTCSYKNKNETEDFLNYFIKTLKNELQRISEERRGYG